MFMRYDRHILFDKIGDKGQEKLKKSKVTIIGLGGLGSSVSLYLVGAGVGEIRIIDNDKIDIHNLQRQILYTEGDIGKFKADVAEKRLSKTNKKVKIIKFREKFDGKNNAVLEGVDLVIDCTDNLKSRFLMNKICFEKNIPIVHGAVVADYGWISFIKPGETACLKCIIPEKAKPTSSSEIGILNSAPGVIGTIQATEAIKYLAGFGENLKNILLFVELSNNRFNKIKIKPNCEICSSHL